MVGPGVGGGNDGAGAAVEALAGSVAEGALIHHLEKAIVHQLMCLLEFIEENDRERMPLQFARECSSPTGQAAVVRVAEQVVCR